MGIPALVRLKLEMEFGIAPAGDVLPPPRSNPDGHPRFVVSRYQGGFARFLRHDVPEATRRRLLALGPERAVEDEAAVRAALERDAPLANIWRVRWYVIERSPAPDEYPEVVVQHGRHVILVDGEVVARARTEAESERAAEVGVETLPAYRRRGYARQVVASWAAATLRQGKVAYYSHTADNLASAAVARSLGLTLLSDEVEYQ
ncbi:MAG TPA: GNAT family N-acetyltransferase [Thermomicrobiaceae bacterium]|nr:GNAT family N-acetyltransferase [Thermomicrobiaceae bacterium]